MAMSVSPTADKSDKVAVSYKEAGRLLGICERSAWALVNSGQLKVIRIGRSVRIPLDELRRYVEENAGAIQSANK